MDSVFKLCEKRYQLDSAMLRARREATHASQTEFAGLCGWSCAYQCRLENVRTGDTLEVSEATAHIVDSVLRELEERQRVKIAQERKRFEKFLEDTYNEGDQA